MKKLILLKNKFSEQRLSTHQAKKIKGGDDKRKPRPTSSSPLPGGGDPLPNSVIEATLDTNLSYGT